MFILFTEDQILSFKTCAGLHSYIRYLERKRKGEWVFARYPYQRLALFYQYIRTRKAASLSMGAIGMDERVKPDVLEILTGDLKKPQFLSVTSDVDVGALQEKWCREYCLAHGHALRKVSSPDQVKEALKGQGGRHD